MEEGKLCWDGGVCDAIVHCEMVVNVVCVIYRQLRCARESKGRVILRSLCERDSVIWALNRTLWTT